jgi:hypothetical protein
MSIFSEQILKALNDYKRLLKRYVSSQERENAIIKIGIKRKSLKLDNDVILFNKAHRVLQDIEYWLKKLNRTGTEYSGITGFYQYLNACLSQYQVENNAIVHVTQKVSCALVQAIQLVSLPLSQLSDSHVSKLEECIHLITKFGTKEQHGMLANAVKQQKTNEVNSNLPPALDKFIQNHCDNWHEELCC